MALTGTAAAHPLATSSLWYSPALTLLQMIGHHCQYASLRLTFQLGCRPRGSVRLVKHFEALQRRPGTVTQRQARRTERNQKPWLYLVLVGGPSVRTARRRVGGRGNRRNGACDVYSLADVRQVGVALLVGPIRCRVENTSSFTSAALGSHLSGLPRRMLSPLLADM